MLAGLFFNVFLPMIPQVSYHFFSPLGTAQWAKGPIDWTKAPSDIHAIVKSVKVECPNT